VPPGLVIIKEFTNIGKGGILISVKPPGECEGIYEKT
jgi:hypothetical protein